MVAVLNKPPTVAEYENMKPPTVAEYDKIEPQKISAWEPTFKERVKNVISGMMRRSPFVEPGKRLGQLGVHYFLESVSGIGFFIPDIIASKISEEDTLASAIDKFTGFEPTSREVGAGEAAKFITSLHSVGRILGPAIAAIPARPALQVILGSGVTFGGRKATEELAKKISTGKAVDVEGIHFEGGIGVLFGAGTVGVSKFVNFIKNIRALPKAQIRPARAEADRALKLRAKGKPEEWERVVRKYGFGQAAEPRPIPTPAEKVQVREFGKYPLARPIKRPPTVPVTAPEKPVAGRKAEIAPVTQPEAVGKVIVFKPIKDPLGGFSYGRTLNSLPPIKEGMIRLYRAETGVRTKTIQGDIEDFGQDDKGTGGWFTTDFGYALNFYQGAYGKTTAGRKMVYMDVSKQSAKEHFQGTIEGEKHEYFYPELRVAKPKAVEVAKIQTAETITGDTIKFIKMSKAKGEKYFAEQGFVPARNKNFLVKGNTYVHYNRIDKSWHIEEVAPPKPKAVEKAPTVAEYEAPKMATQAQKARAHIIADSKAFISEKGKMRPGYRALAKAMTGQRSIAKMTEQQADDFINALNKLPEPRMKGGRLIPPSIARTTKLVPKGFFQRRFKRPTPIGLITSNAYYAEKLGVKSLVEPLEKAKMRFDLEHHSASNEIDKMGQKIDVLGKTTAKEKITAKIKNIPTKARAEMGYLLDNYEDAPANLDPKKKKIFDWFRNLTRTMLVRQNEARAKLEMPLIKGRKAYMRHIATDISREMLAGKYPFPEGIGFWSGLNTGKKVFNPMEFQRKLEEDIYGLFSKDPVYASKAMMYNALKEIHLNQPLKFFNEQLSALGKDLPEYRNLSPRERAELDKTTVMPADTRRWLIDYVNNVIKGQQTMPDRLINNIVNESGLRGLLNTALRPYGRVLSQRPVTKFFQGAGRVQMAGVMGPRPRLLIRNKFQLTQNLALYGMKANARAFLPPNKELKKLLDESLFLKSYTGLEELPADLAKKVEKLWHTAYQWTATSNARQSMEVAYWDIKELIDNPKYAKYGWKPEHLLKEMEFGASATQYQYNAIGMPGIFRHKSLIPATRLTSWWMNYFAKFHREAIHRAVTGRPSWSGPDGPTLPWSRRLGWLRYAVLGGAILNTMGYTRSYMFGAAPTGWPPALQAVDGLYKYVIADDDKRRKAAKARFYNATKTFIPGYIAYKDFDAVWTGRKDLESLFFYKKRKKKDED